MIPAFDTITMNIFRYKDVDYDILVGRTAGEISAWVQQDGTPVSPRYSASAEVVSDFKKFQPDKKLVHELVRLAVGHVVSPSP